MASFDEDKRASPAAMRRVGSSVMPGSFSLPLGNLAGGTLTFDEFVGLLAEVTALTNQFRRCAHLCGLGLRLP